MFRIHTNLDKEIYNAIKNIKTYDDSKQKEIRNIVREGTKDVMQEAIRKAPFRTGKLKASITMEFDYDKAQGVVKAKAPHVHLVEFGAKATTSTPNRKKALMAGNKFFKFALIPVRAERPFMRPAIEKEKPEIERKIREVLK
jgi:HK97 gp10 family phage protein